MKWSKREEIQLAYPFTEKRVSKWTPPYIIQPKLDGDRCRAVFNQRGEVTLFSSEVQVIWAVPKIIEQLGGLHLKRLELDGELYEHGRTQAEIHGIVSSQRTELHPEHEKIRFCIFDLVAEQVPQVTRLKYLTQLYKERLEQLDSIGLVPSYLVSTLDEIYHAEKVFISLGYEGFVLRERNAYYRRTRSIYMMKFKPKKKDVYRIEGFNEAISKDGVPKGMVGSFVCSSEGKEGTFPVGAGRLTHEERRLYWEEREAIKGLHLAVEYQHLTSKNGVPRSGVATRVLFTSEEVEEAKLNN